MIDRAAVLAEIDRRYRWRRLNVSVSSGRSSVELAIQLKQLGVIGRRNVVTTFANTSQEAEESLQFQHDADEAYELGTVWLEAKVNPRKGDGTRHRVVTFEAAARNGERFEEVIAKYGLPGPGQLHCTRELKANTIKSYLRSIGWGPGTYDTAIGLRADEVDRFAKDAEKQGFKYWLHRLGLRKDDIIAAFIGRNVTLNLPEALGNCVWCWKKSLTKLIWLMRNHPRVFDFPRLMEERYAYAGAGDGRRRYLFRHHLTVADLEEMAAWPDEQIAAWLADRLKCSKEEAALEMQVFDECHGTCDAQTREAA